MATDLLLADQAMTPLPDSVDSVPGSTSLHDEHRSNDQSDRRALDKRALDKTATRLEESPAKEGRRPSVARDMIELTKPRIVTMIAITTLSTALLGAEGWVPLVEMVWLLIGTVGVAASAGAANQIWERVIDCQMPRTAKRPLPAGRLGLVTACVWTSALGIAGTMLLAWRFGMTPAMMGAATWLLYVLVYTPMKVRTSWNTTVGAVAGALPVMIGYTATGGGLDEWAGWLLVGVLAAWQYPHFMAIAWMYRRQYDEAGFKMTTTVEPTGRSAGRQSILGSATVVSCAVALCWLQPGVWIASIASALVFAAVFPMLRQSMRFSACPDDVQARKLLRSSLLVLPAVLLVVTLRVFW
ncbi:MAG: protoheme IX farnesyltransferase [Planctomycetota bacterium]